MPVPYNHSHLKELLSFTQPTGMLLWSPLYWSVNASLLSNLHFLFNYYCGTLESPFVVIGTSTSFTVVVNVGYLSGYCLLSPTEILPSKARPCQKTYVYCCLTVTVFGQCDCRTVCDCDETYPDSKDWSHYFDLIGQSRSWSCMPSSLRKLSEELPVSDYSSWPPRKGERWT